MYTCIQRCEIPNNWSHVDWTIWKRAERTISVYQLFPPSVLLQSKQTELLAESARDDLEKEDCKTSGADGMQRLHTAYEDTKLNLLCGKKDSFRIDEKLNAGVNYFVSMRWRMVWGKPDSWYRRCCLCLTGAVVISQHSHLETFVHLPFSCLSIHLLLQER